MKPISGGKPPNERIVMDKIKYLRGSLEEKSCLCDLICSLLKKA